MFVLILAAGGRPPPPHPDDGIEVNLSLSRSTL